MFLLSNNIHILNKKRNDDQGLEFLCSLFDHDTSLTTALLQIRTSTVRAAWESLLIFSMLRSRRESFRIFTNIGIYNHWLNPLQAGECLHNAVKMGCFDTVRNIVLYFRDSGSNHWWQDSLKAILAACWQRNAECACLLLQHCDVNATRIRPFEQSMFQELVTTFDDGNHGKALALDLFLANGADVDQSMTSAFMDDVWRLFLRRRWEIHHSIRPTTMDYVFYFHRSLFDKLAPYSTLSDSEITRTGLLVASEHGAQSLQEYLVDRQPKTPSFNWEQNMSSILELLLVEQFSISKMVDLRIVRSLLEYGVDFEKVQATTCDFDPHWIQRKWFHRQWFLRLHADHLGFAWHQFANVHERVELLDMLLTRGAVVGECVFDGAVAQYGTRGLECLAVQPEAFSTKAVRALTTAARLNDFEAVDLLFRKGVGPDAFITSTADSRSYSIQAVATGALCYKRRPAFYEERDYERRTCSLEMMQFLARYGAKLIVTSEDSTPFDFVDHLLRRDTSDLFAKVKYVLGTMMGVRSWSTLPAFLLESCFFKLFPCDNNEERLEIFEYLYRQGAEVSPGSPLAALVYARGPEELVRDVMSSGSDLNAYWDGPNGTCTPLQMAARLGDETLVRLFLREGADVNSPARSCTGFTALQAICQWSIAIAEEHRLRMRICSLLIDQGADLNAAPAELGNTALGWAAIMGDLELAALLIHEGADINASRHHNGSALDYAASSGRLDTVKFLLNANALSAGSGTRGYDGAVGQAVSSGHFAVADLIREHAAKVEAGTLFNPELEKQ